MGSGFKPLIARLEELDGRLRKKADSLSYPEWIMMPTNEGVRFLLATVLLGLASINTGNNLIYLIFGLMLSIIVISYALVSVNISGLEIKVKAPGPVYAGETSKVVLGITNNKKISSYSLKILLPPEFNSAGFVPLVKSGEAFFSSVSVRPSRRGVFGYGNFLVESSFPFIFFRRRRRVRVQGSLIVYPALLEVNLDSLGGKRGRGTDSQRPGEGEELLSLREFRGGDSRKSIHWKASARADTLLVKEYSAHMPKMAEIIIDGSGLDMPDAFEKAVSYAASAAVWLTGRGYYVSLRAPGAEVPYGTGRGHMYRLLDHLAMLNESDELLTASDEFHQGSVILVNKVSGLAGKKLDVEPDLVVYADTL